MHRYPLAHLWSETRFAAERINSRVATDAVMMQSVIAAAIWGKSEPLQTALGKLQDVR